MPLLRTAPLRRPLIFSFHSQQSLLHSPLRILSHHYRFSPHFRSSSSPQHRFQEQLVLLHLSSSPRPSSELVSQHLDLNVRVWRDPDCVHTNMNCQTYISCVP